MMIFRQTENPSEIESEGFFLCVYPGGVEIGEGLEAFVSIVLTCVAHDVELCIGSAEGFAI